jgi:hypothetical protein
MSISSVLLIPRLSCLQSCYADKNNFEREILYRCLRGKEAEKERQETKKAQEETHIVESADSADLFFIWPVPLIFDEFTVN